MTIPAERHSLAKSVRELARREIKQIKREKKSDKARKKKKKLDRGVAKNSKGVEKLKAGAEKQKRSVEAEVDHLKEQRRQNDRKRAERAHKVVMRVYRTQANKLLNKGDGPFALDASTDEKVMRP